MTTEEKVADFLASNHFYNQFLELADFLNLDSVENFLKFTELFKFLDNWFRDNWDDYETRTKVKEFLVDFSDEEIDKIISFLDKNFKEQRKTLWQTEEVLNQEDEEKERRYLEIMASLVKFPEVEKESKQEITTKEQPINEKINFLEGEDLLAESKDKKQEPLSFVEPEKNEPGKNEETPLISTTNFGQEPGHQETPKQTLDNIVISYKKSDEKQFKDDEKFLDLSNL